MKTETKDSLRMVRQRKLLSQAGRTQLSNVYTVEPKSEVLSFEFLPRWWNMKPERN